MTRKPASERWWLHIYRGGPPGPRNLMKIALRYDRRDEEQGHGAAARPVSALRNGLSGRTATR